MDYKPDDQTWLDSLHAKWTKEDRARRLRSIQALMTACFIIVGMATVGYWLSFLLPEGLKLLALLPLAAVWIFISDTQ